jgi:uncharacterized protein (TIGR01777 family)
VSTILLGGASGFIGSRLARSLAADGHRVVRLSRGHRAAAGESVRWNPEAGHVDREQLARVRPDAVINLAGEPIAQRWTSSRRRQIRDSRIRGTTALAEAAAGLPEKPSVFVGGSAIGYYGAHRDDETLDEDSSAGDDFLARTAVDWERATAPATSAGIRVALARTGLVVGQDGGFLERMLLPFRLGLGGRIGSGKQWMSWVAMDDMVRALRFLIDSPQVRGPVNLVAPNPVRNEEFTKTLGRVLGRPTVIPVPKVGLELMFGEMADNTILASQRVIPKRLAGARLEFRHPRLESALRAELRRSTGPADR